MSRGNSWIFRQACGCAFALVDENSSVTTLSKAWKALYPTVRERDEAMDRGVTATLQAWEDYKDTVYDQLSPSWKCPHKAGEVSPNEQ